MEERSRISVRTSDDIDTWLFNLEKVCFRAGLRFKGKKMTKEAIVNAILASASSSEEPEVLRRIRDGVATYETQLEKMTNIPVIK